MALPFVIERAIRGLARAGRLLEDVILPCGCRACDAAIDPEDLDFCETCATQLANCVARAYCGRCGEERHEYLLHDAVCTSCKLGKRPLAWRSIVRVGRYEGPLKSMILKFKQQYKLDHVLGRMLADAILGRLNPSEIDAWTPIPMHWGRRLGKSFQPTMLLARTAVARWNGSVEPLLRMTRFVEPFHARPGLTAKDRTNEIAGAMAPTRGSAIAGRRICLIDDVTTTGATLREACRVLKDAGARSVDVAVVARAARGLRE